MKLIIDIGNTSTKLALFKGKNLFTTLNIKECSIKSVRDFVANEAVSATIISSVKKNNSDLLNILDDYNGTILSETIPVPIKNHYKTPDTLGVDRLAGVIGAHFLYPAKDVIVFDLGTCLTIDFLSKKGEYIGGRISPGIEMRYQALHTFTDKLPLLQKEKNTPIIGNDTTSSIVSGVQLGILAEVKSTISEYRLQNPDTVSVVTGGDCFFFEKELKSSIFANPNLVMIGLNEILDFNE